MLCGQLAFAAFSDPVEVIPMNTLAHSSRLAVFRRPLAAFTLLELLVVYQTSRLGQRFYRVVTF